MVIPSHFQDEINLVDGARSFTEVIDATYGVDEWSVSGWELRGGSDAALSHAASEAMYQMGYRWFTPYISIRPASLPPGGVTLAKQQFAFPYLNFLINYGFGDAVGPEATAYNKWAALMCVDDNRRPHGHTWGSIILANAAHFNANRSHWRDLNDNSIATVEESLGGLTFVLDDPTIRAANLTLCANYLRGVMDAESREIARFDPADGDDLDSDTVFSFANDVVAELRNTTHPNAILNLYAYAGHRAPPSFNCPNLGVQVALGFNDLGLGYPELVRQWGLVCPRVDLRGYGDIAAQKGFVPFYSGIRQSQYFTTVYPEYIAAGATGLNMETSTNWAINIVSHWHMIRFCRYPTNTYADARDEIVTHAFGGDPAATTFFNVLGDGEKSFTAFTWKELLDAVNAMQPGQRKTELQQYCVMVESHMQFTESRTITGTFASRGSVPAGVYFSRLEKNARNVQAMRANGVAQAQAYTRQMLNSNATTNGRADLQVGSGAHWERFPEFSTETDFAAALAHVTKLAARPPELSYASLSDLVLVDVAPQGAAAADPSPATDYYTENGARFIVWNNTGGSVTVTHTYVPAHRGVKVETFGPGVHVSKAAYNATTTWTGGLVFLDAFPRVRLDPSDPSAGQRWMYFPKLVKGKLSVRSDSRLTVIAENGRFDINQDDVTYDIAPGIAQVQNGNTRGFHEVSNANPFFSPSPYKMLMPRALAEREFPNMVLAM